MTSKTKCTIDVTFDGQLEVHIPGVGQGHHIILPANEIGMDLLIDLLQHRREARNKQKRARIGEASSPVQSMVDEWLKTNKVTRSIEPKVTPPEIEEEFDPEWLKEMGLL